MPFDFINFEKKEGKLISKGKKRKQKKKKRKKEKRKEKRNKKKEKKRRKRKRANLYQVVCPNIKPERPDF